MVTSNLHRRTRCRRTVAVILAITALTTGATGADELNTALPPDTLPLSTTLPAEQTGGAPTIEVYPFTSFNEAGSAAAPQSPMGVSAAAPPPVSASRNALRPLAEVYVEARIPGHGSVPVDTSLERHGPVDVGREFIDARPWMPYEFAWAASGLVHRPLYFEDFNLERYGNSACPALQPAISTTRFLATVPLLPYLMTLDPPGECVYTLGYCRPGSKAPNLAYRPKLDAKAAAVEAAFVTGLVFIIP